jgi:cell division initiation protein
MKLTPLDIRTHEFTRKVRGYDPEEVKAFTDMVSRQWEEVLDDLRHARDRVREIEGKIEHYEKVESALHEALETARSGAKRTQEQAEERARLIVEEAELKAEQRLQEAEGRQGRLKHDITDLTRRRDEIVARLRHFLMSELEILARHEDDHPIGFMQLVPSSPAEALPEAPGPSEPSAASDEAPGRAKRQDVDASETEPAQPDEAERGTTYGELYARAAESESEREARRAETDGEDAIDEQDDEPTWTLRSIVGGGGEEEADDLDEREATAPDAEKERIRRILEDLD